MSKSRGLQNIYTCPNRLTANRCSYMIPEDAALRVLASQIDTFGHRTTDVITRIAQSTVASIRVKQTICAQEDRRRWIDENLIRPCTAQGVSIDSKFMVEYTRLGEEIDNLTRESVALDGQTVALGRAMATLRSLSCDLRDAVPQLDARGQAAVYRALLTAAHLAGTGRARSRSHFVRRINIAGEGDVCS
jgi:hypothetical protein